MVFDEVSEMKYDFFDKPIFNAINAATSSSGESAAEEAEAAEEAPAE